MSPSRPGNTRLAAEKKRLKSENPRNKPRSSGKKPVKKFPLDGVTFVLGLVAVILLVLVVLMMDRRTMGTLFPAPESRAGANGDGPVIERVVNEVRPVEEPVLELGIPETVPEEENVPVTGTQENPAEPGDATARLFFVRVSDEGKIGLKSVLRTVPATGSPLTVAVKSLMDGPRPGELSNDVLSLVPEDARLIGARVESGIAFLDFNEEFRFNALGIEGYKAQVEQIVFTATEFLTVDKVQILIEGQRIDFLGGEGFWVGGPLGREDF